MQKMEKKLDWNILLPLYSKVGSPISKLLMNDGCLSIPLKIASNRTLRTITDYLFLYFTLLPLVLCMSNNFPLLQFTCSSHNEYGEKSIPFFFASCLYLYWQNEESQNTGPKVDLDDLQCHVARTSPHRIWTLPWVWDLLQAQMQLCHHEGCKRV